MWRIAYHVARWQSLKEYNNSLTMADTAGSVPLCVDLDGTLLQTDSLHESLFALAKTRPWLLLLLPFWVLSGKAQFKQRVACRITLPVERLPFDERVRTYVQSARESGQPVWLVSGCHQSIANQIAEYMGGFDGVLASNGEVNLTGMQKRDELCRRFGVAGYDYIGNSTADLPVWASARNVLVANATPALLDQVRRQYEIAYHFPLRKR